ncbi:hypothetical protein VTK73DRAFT_4898 [Phialemonium thermophilum]|uniref:Uncharacterized protein n=1 Tax=Phialemonium thermophilum TaxID=223376 RepID=A0ABR3V5F6_9PEZI
MEASKAHYAKAGIELMGDFFMHERHVVLMNMFTYDQQDPAQCRRVHELYYGLYREAKKRGYGMYRAHCNHMGRSISGFLYVTDADGYRPHRQPQRLQRPCLQPLRREDQGRPGPERHPGAGEAGDLAQPLPPPARDEGRRVVGKGCRRLEGRARCAGSTKRPTQRLIKREMKRIVTYKTQGKDLYMKPALGEAKERAGRKL